MRPGGRKTQGQPPGVATIRRLYTGTYDVQFQVVGHSWLLIATKKLSPTQLPTGNIKGKAHPPLAWHAWIKGRGETCQVSGSRIQGKNQGKGVQ